MAPEHDRVALVDVASVQGGYSFKSKDWRETGIPVLKIANVLDGRIDTCGCSYVEPSVASGASKWALAEGDILVGMTGYVGAVGRIRVDQLPAMLNQRVGKFSVDDPELLDADYLFFALRNPSVRQEWEAVATGSAQANISGKQLCSVAIPLPPIDEQRRIAAVLGALDDKIELNRKMSRTLEGIAQAIFKSWFIDFDGVPPEDLVDSELGPIPDGWKAGTLGDVSELDPESWKKSGHPSSVRYIDLSSTKWGRIEAVTEYAWEDAPSRARKVLRPGDTVVGTVRPGNGSYALIAEIGLTGSTGFAVLRPTSPALASFVYLAATRPENIARLAHLADGGAYPAVRPQVVSLTEAAVPPEDRSQEFASVVDPLLARIMHNERESRTLATTRDSLLPKLISGEVRVPELNGEEGCDQ